jgi:hypothetical protein
VYGGRAAFVVHTSFVALFGIALLLAGSIRHSPAAALALLVLPEDYSTSWSGSAHDAGLGEARSGNIPESWPRRWSSPP